MSCEIHFPLVGMSSVFVECSGIYFRHCMDPDFPGKSIVSVKVVDQSVRQVG
jgi:hypothetical protein